MAVRENLSAFFADWAVTATLAGGATMSVIFDKGFIASMGGQIDATQPMCLAKSSDVSANSIVADSAMTISGTAYTVRSLQPDGTGFTVLVLEA